MPVSHHQDDASKRGSSWKFVLTILPLSLIVAAVNADLSNLEFTHLITLGLSPPSSGYTIFSDRVMQREPLKWALLQSAYLVPLMLFPFPLLILQSITSSRFPRYAAAYLLSLTLFVLGLASIVQAYTGANVVGIVLGNIVRGSVASTTLGLVVVEGMQWDVVSFAAVYGLGTMFGSSSSVVGWSVARWMEEKGWSFQGIGWGRGFGLRGMMMVEGALILLCAPVVLVLLMLGMRWHCKPASLAQSHAGSKEEVSTVEPPPTTCANMVQRYYATLSTRISNVLHKIMRRTFGKLGLSNTDIDQILRGSSHRETFICAVLIVSNTIILQLAVTSLLSPLSSPTPNPSLNTTPTLSGLPTFAGGMSGLVSTLVFSFVASKWGRIPLLLALLVFLTLIGLVLAIVAALIAPSAWIIYTATTVTHVGVTPQLPLALERIFSHLDRNTKWERAGVMISALSAIAGSELLTVWVALMPGGVQKVFLVASVGLAIGGVGWLIGRGRCGGKRRKMAGKVAAA